MKTYLFSTSLVKEVETKNKSIKHVVTCRLQQRGIKPRVELWLTPEQMVSFGDKFPVMFSADAEYIKANEIPTGWEKAVKKDCWIVDSFTVEPVNDDELLNKVKSAASAQWTDCF